MKCEGRGGIYKELPVTSGARNILSEPCIRSNGSPRFMTRGHPGKELHKEPKKPFISLSARASPSLAYANLHQILANNQFTGKTFLGFPQAGDRSIAGTDMAQDQRLDMAQLRNVADIIDRRVRGERMTVERPCRVSLLYSLKTDINPRVIDDLMYQHVGAFCQL